jgi:HPt (histidine-containing phosphotransfer) domain-containing protein
MYKCEKLQQETIDDLFHMESQGAKGYIARQVGRFLESVPDHISAIQVGIETVDFDEIRHHAHKVNGFSGILGAFKIREVSMNIETLSIEKNIEGIPQLTEKLSETFENHKKELSEIAEISKKNSED